MSFAASLESHIGSLPTSIDETTKTAMVLPMAMPQFNKLTIVPSRRFPPSPSL